MKKLFFFLLTTIFVLVVMEAGAQAMYFVANGRFPWSPPVKEQFALKNLTEPVRDDRAFTTRPNFVDPKFHIGWYVSSDEFRFRKGTHSTDLGRRNVVFIGDSVPFGWGVGDTQTMSSKLYDLLKAQNDPRGVINAAIPAYTLHQTLSRYEHELHGRVKVDAVYLQIYNPVNQLLLRGPNWKPTDNWATIDIVGHDDKPYWLSQYSAISAIAEKAAYQYLSPETAKRFFRPPSPYLEILSPSDTATLDMFRKQVRSEFEQLLKMAVEDGARRFIVAPITVRKTSRAEFSAARRVAVDTLNDEMRKFAEAHPGQVVYLDTIALLDKLPEKEAFIDDCCHLAEPGNQAVAAQLVELLK